MTTPKNYFNYRMIQDIDTSGHVFFSIRGVHYAKGEIVGWDAEPLTLTFDWDDSPSEYLNALSTAAVKTMLIVDENTLKEHSSKLPAELVMAHKLT